MTTTEPVFVIKYRGNVKEAVFKDSHVWVCTYEPPENCTMVFIQTQFIKAIDVMRAQRIVKKGWEKYGEILNVNYYPMGCTINQPQSVRVIPLN